MPAATLDLEIGHDRPIPILPSNLFPPPLFTPEQQAANPSRPMTRIVKDILHVGTWRVRDEANGDRLVNWTIGEDLMRDLANAHRIGRSRGVAVNLGNTHGDRATRLIHPNDLIAPVEDLKVGNGILWMSSYVTPAHAEFLSNPALKVSPYILGSWEDTGGHVYRAKVMHVAVTDNPIIAGQGPFRFALCDPLTRRAVWVSASNVRRSGLPMAVALAMSKGKPPESTWSTGQWLQGYGAALDRHEAKQEREMARILPSLYGSAVKLGERKFRFQFALAQAAQKGVPKKVINAKLRQGERHSYDPRFLTGLEPPKPRKPTAEEIKANNQRILRRL